MHFERQVKRYSEPVSEAELEIGSVYFSVTFIDFELHIPLMETLVFIGRDLDGNPSDNEFLYFQDIQSHQDGVKYDSNNDNFEEGFFICSKDELGSILNEFWGLTYATI